MMSSWVNSQSTRASQLTETSQPSTPTPHVSAARSALASASSSRSSSPAVQASHDYPVGRNSGRELNIDWNNLWHGRTKLVGARLGYRVQHKSKSLGGRKPASIWRYGADIVYLQDDGVSKKVFFLCEKCHTSRTTACLWDINSGTAHIVGHLQKVHNIDPDKGLMPLAASMLSDPFKKAAGANSTVSHSPWQEVELLKSYVDWVILHDLSFVMATSAGSRGLLTWNRIDLLRGLPNSGNILSGYVKKALEERKEVVRLLLRAARSKISISCDIWTSPNNVDFLGVVAHFVDSLHHQRDVLIAFRALFCDHTGAAQASIIYQVAQEYDFARNIHCFVADNAANNDKTFLAGINDLAEGELYVGPQHRIRCAGHVINLITKSLIYGQGLSKFELELSRASPAEQYLMFRKKGVIGKLHNFVNSVCASHKRRRLFMSLQRQALDDDELYNFSTLNLIKDGGIRWHSTYAMLLRCLELRKAIRLYTKHLRDDDDDDDAPADGNYDPHTDGLSDDDWDEVSVICNVLQLFHENCKSLEGNAGSSRFGSLWQTVFNLQEIYEVLTDDVPLYEYYGQSRYLQNGVAFAMEKLITYFVRLVIDPEPSLYCVATALHPRLRLRWFQTHWSHHPHWIRKAKKSLEVTFATYLAAEQLTEDDDSLLDDLDAMRKVPGAYKSSARRQRTMWVEPMLLTGTKQRKRQKQSSQLEDYNESILEDLHLASQDQRLSELLDDPHRWWTEVGQTRFPILYKVAMDHLSVPATSCDCERCFSSAKRTITCDRNSLSPATIEACQLQKNWLMRDVVPSYLKDLTSYINRKENAPLAVDDDNRALDDARLIPPS